MMASPYLIISDLQIPFEAPKALEFCKYVKRHYKVQDDRVLNVGDEVDQYWGGMWKKSIHANHTALQEIKESIKSLRGWYDAFPQMKLCTSNHGDRWLRKAMEAEIPSIMLRDYREVLECPKDWVWRKNWVIKSKHPFMIEHGDDYGGEHPHIVAVQDNGMSIAIGHHHSKASITYRKTKGVDAWGAVIGCLIDEEAYAFEYAKKNRLQQQHTILLVTEDGRIPFLLPMET